LSLGDDGPGHSGQTLAPRPPWQTLRSRPISADFIISTP
jgi:hypothetical protein